jgi:hypothetical protein
MKVGLVVLLWYCYDYVCFCVQGGVFESFLFFFLQINFFMILYRFDMLMSNINFKNKKNIILMYFRAQNTLKNNHHHNHRHYLSQGLWNTLLL